MNVQFTALAQPVNKGVGGVYSGAVGHFHYRVHRPRLAAYAEDENVRDVESLEQLRAFPSSVLPFIAMMSKTPRAASQAAEFSRQDGSKLMSAILPPRSLPASTAPRPARTSG